MLSLFPPRTLSLPCDHGLYYGEILCNVRTTMTHLRVNVGSQFPKLGDRFHHRTSVAQTSGMPSVWPSGSPPWCAFHNTHHTTYHIFKETYHLTSAPCERRIFARPSPAIRSYICAICLPPPNPLISTQCPKPLRKKFLSPSRPDKKSLGRRQRLSLGRRYAQAQHRR